jgi:ABC-type antimicrobial peptide transport system permease subunit
MGADSDVRPQTFMPTRNISEIALMVRTAREPMTLAGAVSSAVWSVDKDQPVSDIKTMEEHLRGGNAQRRFNMVLFAGFAGLALLLSAVGIYGVLSYGVTQRRQEIGIRMALGADSRRILRLVAAQGFAVALIGVAIGLAGALALTRLMSSIIFGVQPNDPVTFAGVTVVISLVALLASYFPARRAARMDPVQSMRAE